MSFFLISYKRNDSEDFVNMLQDRLHAEGLFTWRDTRNIPGGEEWQQEIEIGIKKCHAVLLILTDKAIESKPIEFEWIYALGAGKQVIPLKIREFDESKMHYRLRSIQHMPFTPENRDWDYLIDSLKEIERLSTGDLPLAITNAMQDLQSTDLGVRLRGMEMLKNYDLPNENRSVIYALTEALKFGIRGVDMMAAVVLTTRTSDPSILEKALPILRPALLGIFEIFNETIIDQLDIQSGAELVQAYHDEFKVTQNKTTLTKVLAAEALYKIDDPKLVDILYKVVKTNTPFGEFVDPTNRINSIQLLSHITDDDEIFEFFYERQRSHPFPDEENFHSAYKRGYTLMYHRRRE